MPNKFPNITLVDGHIASATSLAPLAFSGFAHFTAMQVRSRKVRGFDLHLQRLRSASKEMFGAAHDDDEIISALKGALDRSPEDLSLTATIFSRAGEFTATGVQDDPAILVRTFPPQDGPLGPLKLDIVTHERPMPTIKHVGEATKTHYLRKAVEKGFDDAAYFDSQGRATEATIWNLVFWDGEEIVWPKGQMLNGVTMQIIARQLEKMGIPQSNKELTLHHISSLKGAAVMNSWTPCVPVSAIGSVQLPIANDFHSLLRQAYQAEDEVTL